MSFCKKDTVNHLVGGSSPSRGVRKYEGLAVVSQPLFLFGRTMGAFLWRRSLRFPQCLSWFGRIFITGMWAVPPLMSILPSGPRKAPRCLSWEARGGDRGRSPSAGVRTTGPGFHLTYLPLFPYC